MKRSSGLFWLSLIVAGVMWVFYKNQILFEKLRQSLSNLDIYGWPIWDILMFPVYFVLILAGAFACVIASVFLIMKLFHFLMRLGIIFEE